MSDHTTSMALAQVFRLLASDPSPQHRCWGSGDELVHFVDLRRLRATEDHRVAERAAELFSQRCGVGLKSIRPGLLELIGELEKFGRGRKVRAEGFDVVCRCLASLLKELAG